MNEDPPQIDPPPRNLEVIVEQVSDIKDTIEVIVKEQKSEGQMNDDELIEQELKRIDEEEKDEDKKSQRKTYKPKKKIIPVYNDEGN